jgi:hypothetical protein
MMHEDALKASTIREAEDRREYLEYKLEIREMDKQNATKEDD